MGKKTETLRPIEEACAHHDTFALVVKLPSLKGDPQYEALMVRIKLSQPPQQASPGTQLATRTDLKQPEAPSR